MCIKSKCFAKIADKATEKENKDLKIRKKAERTNIKVKAKMQRSLINVTKNKKAHSVGLGYPDTIANTPDTIQKEM